MISSRRNLWASKSKSSSITKKPQLAINWLWFNLVAPPGLEPESKV